MPDVKTASPSAEKKKKKTPSFFILCKLASIAEITLFKAMFLNNTRTFKSPGQLKNNASAQAPPQTNRFRTVGRGVGGGYLHVLKLLR